LSKTGFIFVARNQRARWNRTRNTRQHTVGLGQHDERGWTSGGQSGTRN